MLNMIADTSLRADTCDTCKKNVVMALQCPW